MELFSKCPVCRKQRIYLAKRTYTLPHPPGRVTSDQPMCNHCFGKQKLLTLGHMSWTIYLDYARFKITNFIHDYF